MSDSCPAADSAEGRALWDRHAAALVAANDDRGIDKPVADPCATPLMAVARTLPRGKPLAAAAREIAFRRERCDFLTRRASFDVWSVLSGIEALFSDIRRIEPRFELSQLSGTAGPAPGNRYRLAVADPAYIARLNAAMAELDKDFGGGVRDPADAAIGTRRMDLRVVRAGPFGGETAGLVIETLANHRLAGIGSLWIVAHADDGATLRVSLEACEMFRWNWAAEQLADARHAAPPGDDARILNWPWGFERAAHVLDGEPLPGCRRSEARVGPWPDIGADPDLREALRSHPALQDLAARFDGER